jgi:hypothetical protein
VRARFQLVRARPKSSVLAAIALFSSGPLASVEQAGASQRSVHMALTPSRFAV